MERIRALLKPRGYLLVEMPNIEGWSKRWVRFSVNTGLHRRRFPPDFAAGHCCEYSRAAFEALLARSGFELVRWETYTNAILDLAEQCGVTLLVTLGGTYDAVSHHGEITVPGAQLAHRPVHRGSISPDTAKVTCLVRIR